MGSEYRAFYRISSTQIETYRRKLLQVAIVAGVMVLSIVLGTNAERRWLMLILAVPAGYIALKSLRRWPALGLLALVAGSFLLQINFGPVNIVIVLPIALVGFWLLNMVVVERRLQFISSPTFLPLLLFMAVAIIAFISGQLPWFPVAAAPIEAQIGGMLIFVAAILTYIITAHYVEDVHWLKLIVWLFIFLGALAILGRVSPALRPFLHPWFAGGVFGSVFWLWFIALTSSNSLFNKKLKIPWRVLLMIITLVTLHNAAVVYRDWSSGWVPAVVALGVIIWIGLPRLALPVSIVGVLAMLDMGLIEILFEELVYADNEYSIVTRMEAWQILFEIIKVNPILGVGPSNYYWYTPLYDILGWYVQFNSHHNLIDIVAQTGVAGLVCILWFFWRVSKLCLSLRLRVPQDGFVYAFVLAACGGLVGMFVATMLGDWVIPFFYNVGVNGFRAAVFGWLFLGALVAVEQMLNTGKLDNQAAE